MDYTTVELYEFFNSMSAHRMDGTLLATDISVPKLERLFQARTQYFNRKDLGTWRGFCLDVTDKGKVFFACADETAHMDGASIWIEKKPFLDAALVIDLIKSVGAPETTQYLNPQTGYRIPSPMA